jgi:hypothetical protein
MSNMQRQVSQRKQVKSALERIDTLEQDMQRLFGAVNNSSMMMSQRMTELGAILEAVVEILDTKLVDQKIKEIADRKTLENLDRAKAAVAAGLASGELVKAMVIDEKSLIIGREIQTDGEIVFPGQVQLKFSQVKPEFQEKLKGQGVGFQIDTGSGKFEVLEVLEVVEPVEPPAPVAAPQAAAPAEAVPAQASEVVAAVTPAETPEQLEAVLAPSEA